MYDIIEGSGLRMLSERMGWRSIARGWSPYMAARLLSFCPGMVEDAAGISVHDPRVAAPHISTLLASGRVDCRNAASYYVSKARANDEAVQKLVARIAATNGWSSRELKSVRRIILSKLSEKDVLRTLLPQFGADDTEYVSFGIEPPEAAVATPVIAGGGLREWL